MKIKLGNTLGFKLFPRQYEAVDINASFEIEKEIEDYETLKAETEKMSREISSVLSKELKKIVKIALEEQKLAKKNL